ncbi:ubiA prenyltransferase family protein [Hirsutella rhossiliensis]|uniref:UbiA prenyltransferase family domain-containing protein n=1 Tax=Hirsutella rhossiliensis TaxID=111463 RepID=A0A9P8N7C3_9HYPO|nr:ubiA prenyltransferase family domain-containing protein [Hirsutella rhossiliensis]KAH0967882.1 ubiA prenyltransferase family domain-containing protein [Hirsutella rhossiliensis]
MTSTGSSKADDALSKQYGGSHIHGWIERLPTSWIPFIQLARLSPPAALFLIYFPHLFGVLHAAHRLPQGTLVSDLVRTGALLFGGSFFFSNAAHSWNDLIDAPIDKQVVRSKNRPIAAGAATFLLVLRPETGIATIPTIIGTVYYPWAKLHTYFPHHLSALAGFRLTANATTVDWDRPVVATTAVATNMEFSDYDQIITLSFKDSLAC